MAEVAPLPTPVVVVQPERPVVLEHHECEAPLRAGCAPVARVRIEKIRLSSPTCVVDTQIKEGDVGQLMKCPNGSFIQFPDAVFGGTFDGVQVNACMKTEFPFSDGCTWQTMQRISGRADVSMTYTYSERAISGHGCSPAACTAHAEIFAVP